MQSQTKIFSQLVRDYMRKGGLVLPAETTVAQLIAEMVRRKRTSALVTDREGRLSGIITEQDITRRIALRCSGEEPATAVMTAPVESVSRDDYLYVAIARMRRFGWRHMPVTDPEERPVGIIDLNAALAVAAEQILRQIDRIVHENSLDGLREVKAAQVEVADELFRDRVPAPEIQAVLSDINRGIHRRVIRRNLAAMRDTGWGEPPVPFALLIMGSGGRGESFLYPDQDNGFILDDYPDSEHERIDGFFIELAERMTLELDQIGFPYCNGYVMATNPLWRKSRSQWAAQLRYWGRKRSEIAVQLSDIFFDFTCGYGDANMVRELRTRVTEMLRASPGFLQEMQAEVRNQGVALGWFGRLQTETEKKEFKGKINLKHRGTLPLVSCVRLLALREGVEATSTLGRIGALHDKGVFDRDTQDYLKGAFRHITGLLLRQQIADFKAGESVSNYTHPDDLSEREKDILIDSFRAIEGLRDRVYAEFTGDVF
ncbi:MAG: putative nucleotidyltransferase substrate binding domain-containing protein [Kiloniellales bacterium]|nr:putative nucleotidyltransferase substrate binding domain-containing protein [Kiloniellales bacterium]